MSDPFAASQSELPRDRWGRPLITPPEGGEPVAYTRCTTFVGALEDTYHLSLWSQRMVALGMSRRRDLVLSASAITDPQDRFQKRTLNDIAKSAKDAAAGDAAANTGTAIHSLTERLDRGLPLGDFVPEEYLPDIRAYATITKGLDPIGIEGFCVRDDLRVGGSYDRIYAFTDEFLDAYEARHGQRLYYPMSASDNESYGEYGPDAVDVVEVRAGDAVIGDVKTGHVDLGAGKIAMQLGVYANSEDYDHTIGTRSPLKGNPSKDWGLVVHLPAGTGTARLLWFDIRAGFETASTLAKGVHAWRKRKDLTHEFTTVSAVNAPALSLVEQIAAAPSYAALTALYAANATQWTPGLTAAAKARRAELEAS